MIRVAGDKLGVIESSSGIIIDRRMLAEFTARDILKGVDWDFISMRKHWADTRRRGVQYVPYNSSNPRNGSNGSYLFFKTPLSPRSINRGYTKDAWYQTVQLQDLDEALRTPDLNLQEKVNLAIAGELRVHCTCPAFNWWGYRYIVTQLDTEIYSQPIKPDIRNPGRRGVICKHLATVLQVLPFWWSDISRDLKAQGYTDDFTPGGIGGVGG
jgi:hypothetical protein